MKAYGHAFALVFFALILAAGAPLETVVVPFLLIEFVAICINVHYEWELWRDR